MNTAVKELDTAVQAGNVDAAKSRLRQGPPVLRARRVRRRGLRAPRLPAEDNAGNLDYLIDMRESTPVDAAVGWSRLPRRRARPVAGRAITDETKKYSSRAGHQRRQARRASSGRWSTARGPRQRRRGPDRRGAERQDHRRGGAVQPHRPGRLRRERRRRPAGLRLAAARPGADRRRAGQDDWTGSSSPCRRRSTGYRDPNAIGGFKPYTPELQASDAAKLTAAIQPLHESLAAVAQKVV